MEKPHIFIYLVDTLRPDHLSVYGYDRATCPNLEDLTRDSVVFDEAYTPATWTRPATASLLTGLLPYRHGAVTLSNKLPNDIELVSETLQPLDYLTSAFVANVNVIDVWGFNQGYNHFDDVKKRTGSNDAEAVVNAALEFLSTGRNDPVFMFLHTMDPHSPYQAPQPYCTHFNPDKNWGALLPVDLTENTQAEALAQTVDAYDSEIFYNDFQFGRFVAGLKAQGLYEDAFIFYLSDHGEEFLEHGAAGHSHSIYQELVKVPMVVKFPGNAFSGSRSDLPVSLLDVVPTIRTFLGKENTGYLDGLDLRALVAGKNRGAAKKRPLLFDLDMHKHTGEINIVSGALVQGYKMIQRTHPEEMEACFYLPDDPLEKKNLIEEERDRAEYLKGLVKKSRLEAGSGLQLRIVNALDDRVRIVQGELVTTGRFIRLKKDQLEAEDHVKLLDSGKRLTFKIVCRNYVNPTSAFAPSIVDEDSISFRLDPADATFEITAYKNGASDSAALFLGRERKPAGIPITLNAFSPELFTLDEAATRSTSLQAAYDLPAGGYLFSVFQPDAAIENVKIDESLKERLRALGYIE